MPILRTSSFVPGKGRPVCTVPNELINLALKDLTSLLHGHVRLGNAWQFLAHCNEVVPYKLRLTPLDSKYGRIGRVGISSWLACLQQTLQGRKQAKHDLRAHLPAPLPFPLKEKPHLHLPSPALRLRTQLAQSLTGGLPPDEQSPVGQELPV